MKIGIGSNGELSSTMITVVSKISVLFRRVWMMAMTASTVSAPTDKLKIISYFCFGRKCISNFYNIHFGYYLSVDYIL